MRRYALAIVTLGGIIAGLSASACKLDTNGEASVSDDGSSEGETSVADDAQSRDGALAYGDGPPTDDVTEQDAKMQDAPTDATAADTGSVCNASNCGGACCGNRCVARTCAGCEVGPFFCSVNGGSFGGSNGSCVADCTACQNGTGDAAGTTRIGCVTCSGGTTLSTCVATPAQCPSGTGACP